MKPPSASTPASEPRKISGRGIGLGILIAVVVAVAAWLQLQSGHAISTPNAVSPAPPKSVDLSRFRSDAWYLPADTLLGFVEIPEGRFVMGSDPTVDTLAFANEQWSIDRNQGTVILPTFYIGRYEVTVAQYGAFVAATRYKANQLVLESDSNHPVTNVSWIDALAYSHWLESQLRESPNTPASLAQLLHDGWKITIPNEAQWEKAARSSDGRIYPWGNTASHDYANYEGTSTTPVGTFVCPKCAFNLADMSGNVWELTRSPYHDYANDLASQTNLQSDALFVMRGGAYNEHENTIRAALRGRIDPGARRPFIGFRVVLTQD